MICSQCREVHYCNRICQKAHWSEHNQACREAPTKRKVPSVVKRAHLVFLFEPNMEGYELDPMKKFYSPRHVYAQHKFLKGQHLTGSGKDLAYLSNSCPPEGPEWNALLDHSISDADQDLLWQVYWRKVSAIANVQLSVDDDVLALHDVPVDGELSMNAPGRWLAIQIHQFICNMIWMKYSFVPKEVIDNPDPQCKEEYWTKEIEPEIKLLIRPQCFTIVGGFRRDQLKYNSSTHAPLRLVLISLSFEIDYFDCSSKKLLKKDQSHLKRNSIYT